MCLSFECVVAVETWFVVLVFDNDRQKYMAGESTDSTAESSSCSEEIKPISSFINNRRKMLDVAFSAVSPNKLKAIIPPFLKDTTLDELKFICYEELCCLTDDTLQSILEDSNWDEPSSMKDKKTASNMEICSHEPRTVCGFEACKPQDTTISINSKHKDILEIEISEEEVSHLEKEIPNSQHISKDTLLMPSPPPSVVSTSGMKHCVSDDVSQIPRDSLHIVEVEPDALNEDLLELLELEHRARSIRSLIMQCDSEREKVLEVSDKSREIASSEHANMKYSNVDGMTVIQKHQELDPLFCVCAPASNVVLTSCKERETNLNKLTLYERVDHSTVLVSGDYTVMETKIPENCSTEVALDNVKDDDSETLEFDSTSTLQPQCDYNSRGVHSIFNNTNQLRITISALNGDSKSKKDLQTNLGSSEKLKEKNIHKVVETSKMCTKLRERIKRTQQLKKFKESNNKAKTVILGTVEEYKSLNTK